MVRWVIIRRIAKWIVFNKLLNDGGYGLRPGAVFEQRTLEDKNAYVQYTSVYM